MDSQLKRNFQFNLNTMHFVFKTQVDNMKLNYDNIGRRTLNTAGVKIKVPNFGETEPLEWLTRGVPSLAYFYDITQALVDKGYNRKESIFGAPYDFRRGPSKLKLFFLIYIIYQNKHKLQCFL